MPQHRRFGKSRLSALQSARVGYRALAYQSAWLDGNGNGVPYPQDANDEGAGRNLGLAQLSGLAGEPPYIEPPTLPTPAGATPVLLQVKLLDEDLAATTAWLELTRPSTAPPSPPPGSDTPVSHAERVDLTYNSVTGRFEAAFAFDEPGMYQFVFQARDIEGREARPRAISLRVGAPLFLPLIISR